MIAVGPRTNGPASLSIAVPLSLPPAMRFRVREIVRLRTDEAERGKGHASRLLALICAEADDTATTLFLHVKPDGGLPMTALAKLYLGHGFVPIQAEPLLMTRMPGRVAGNA